MCRGGGGGVAGWRLVIGSGDGRGVEWTLGLGIPDSRSP